MSRNYVQPFRVKERERRPLRRKEDKSWRHYSRLSSQRPPPHTCTLAQVDERPYRALSFTAVGPLARLPTFSLPVMIASGFVNVATQKTLDFLTASTRGIVSLSVSSSRATAAQRWPSFPV